MLSSNVMNDSDLAKLLQEEYDRESAEVLEESSTAEHATTLKSSHSSYPTSLSPIDPSLELLDPNPNIHLLFLQFNTQFFWSALSGIEVKWSPRMTLCAGLCVYEGRGGLCSVRLSLPLLKLRPRKDLVETLLHEMIHAYLFVTDNDRDHDGHGPNFQSHMHRINKATGAHISVYHTFHDEVESYQQHWWRCDGPCKSRPPYFGYVKRAMNRAPSARDFWWPDHQASCGGTYTKVKEPADYGQKKGGKEKPEKPANSSISITRFWGQGNTLGSTSGKIQPPADKSNSSPRSWSSQGSHGNNQLTNQTHSHKTFVSGPSSSDTLSQGKSLKIPSAGSNGLNQNKILKQTEFTTSSHSNLVKTAAVNRSQTSGSSPMLSRKSLDSGAIPKFGNSGKNNRRSVPPVTNKPMFSKHFVSVCDGGEFSGEVKKKAVYIFDELDTDDGLWEAADQAHRTSQSKVSASLQNSTNVDCVRRIGEPSNNSKRTLVATSAKHGEVVGNKTSYIPKNAAINQENSGNSNSRNKMSGSLASIKVTTSSNVSGLSPGQAGQSVFTGSGFKLGNGRTTPSCLAQAQKTIQPKLTGQNVAPRVDRMSPGTSNPGKLKPVSGTPSSSNKRTSSSLLDSCDKHVVQANKISRTEHAGNASGAASHSPNFMRELSRSQLDSVSVARVQVPAERAEAPSQKVACPVCTVLVLADRINEHLDLCLVSC